MSIVYVHQEFTGLILFLYSLSYHYSQSGEKNAAKTFEYSCLSVESLCKDEMFELILPYVKTAWSCASTPSKVRLLKRLLEHAQNKVRAKISQGEDGPGASVLLTMIDDRLSATRASLDQGNFHKLPFLSCLISTVTLVRSLASLKKSHKIHVQS